jgi:C4-dicarboxylate-specific signal transduction histidine kinase
LAAVLDSTQSAERWLADDPPDVLSAHAAIRQASDDARHMANVVDRLHHVVQQPDLASLMVRISLLDAAKSAVDLLQPRWEQLGIAPEVTLTGPEFTVMAAPQALAQIIHNLLINAAQALERVPLPQRSLSLVLTTADHRGLLSVQDTGTGIANNIVTHIFEPFFTTRKGSLGLGLSLCETLTNSMGGTLTAFNRVPRGAEFCVALRLAD